jgi:hypothetical protein
MPHRLCPVKRPLTDANGHGYWGHDRADHPVRGQDVAVLAGAQDPFAMVRMEVPAAGPPDHEALAEVHRRHNSVIG